MHSRTCESYSIHANKEHPCKCWRFCHLALPKECSSWLAALPNLLLRGGILGIVTLFCYLHNHYELLQAVSCGQEWTSHLGKGFRNLRTCVLHQIGFHQIKGILETCMSPSNKIIKSLSTSGVLHHSIFKFVWGIVKCYTCLLSRNWVEISIIINLRGSVHLYLTAGCSLNAKHLEESTGDGERQLRMKL